MTLEELLGYTNEQFAAMTDEEMAKLLAINGIMEPKSDIIERVTKSGKPKINKSTTKKQDVSDLLNDVEKALDELDT